MTYLGKNHASLLPFCTSESDSLRGLSIKFIKINVRRERGIIVVLIQLGIIFKDLCTFERRKVLDVREFCTFALL